jgi:hypothetical protein
MSVLTAVKLAVDILLAVRVEILHVDILPSFISATFAFNVIRLAAVVAEGKACVFTTPHLVDDFGVTVINPYDCVIVIIFTSPSEESLCKK